MKKTFAFACFGAFCSFGVLAASAAEGVVTADLLNIRTQPDIKAPVAVKLDKGFRVDVLGESGEFVEIAVPVTAPVYISAVYLNVDKTTAPLKMYVTGSSSSASYGLLPKGSAVKVLEIDRFGWARIEPPAGIRLYAAKRYVKYTPEVKPEAGAKKDVKPEAGAEEDVKPEVKPEAGAEEKAGAKKDVKPEVKPEAGAEEKAGAKKDVKPEVKAEAKKEVPAAAKMGAATETALREIGVDLSKGKAVTATGSLLKIENTTVPLLQYALMKNNVVHEYYVCADSVKLDSFGSAALAVRGRSFRVPGWRVPVLYVESAAPVK